ncbi:MAG: D-alanyl-D-alanine carboxypeptidase family protein [Polyangiaceae bacterium]|nr:D-alanyl-D-alanine carboxypeptidase family protein [Polyangiaceae bacterium]
MSAAEPVPVAAFRSPTPPATAVLHVGQVVPTPAPGGVAFASAAERRAAFAPPILGAPVVVAPEPTRLAEPVPAALGAASPDPPSPPARPDDARLELDADASAPLLDSAGAAPGPDGAGPGDAAEDAGGSDPALVASGPEGESEDGVAAPSIPPPRAARVDWRYLVPFVLLLPAVLAAVYAGSLDPAAPDDAAAALAKVATVAPAAAAGADSAGDPSAPPTGSARATDPALAEEDGPGAAVSGTAAPAPPRHRPAPGATIEDELKKGCSTTVVRGLSEQIIAECNCIAPGTFARVPEQKNLKLGDAVFPFLAVPARDALLAALKGAKKLELHVTSMLRTIPQQYLLYSWYQQKRCGITLASSPGESNHQSGLALDIQNFGEWRKPLAKAGFQWLGQQDKWHFDFKKAGVFERPGLDVLAYQRLWNRNHPDDRIPETGTFDSGTEQRLRRSPLGGFGAGAVCGAGRERGAGTGTSPSATAQPSATARVRP